MSEFTGFRYLRANEIECRVATVKQPSATTGTGGGCSLLLYKDARVDMRLLDERFGQMGWQRHHRSIDGRLYCTIAVKAEDGTWVEKEDVGTESYTEKEKGQASDSFKRAAFCWGIGRELYTSPFIWVNLNKDEWRKDARGGYVPKVSFEVTEFEVVDGQVTKVVICDRNGEVRYQWENGVKHEQPKVTEDDSDFELALQNIKTARTREELTQIWNELTAYHNRQDFIDALNVRMNEIAKQKAA